MACVVEKGEDPREVEAAEEVSRSEFRLPAGGESPVSASAGLRPPEGGTGLPKRKSAFGDPLPTAA